MCVCGEGGVVVEMGAWGREMEIDSIILIPFIFNNENSFKFFSKDIDLKFVLDKKKFKHHHVIKIFV